VVLPAGGHSLTTLARQAADGGTAGSGEFFVGFGPSRRVTATQNFEWLEKAGILNRPRSNSSKALQRYLPGTAFLISK